MISENTVNKDDNLAFLQTRILKAFKALSINVFLKVDLGDSQEALVVKNLPASAEDTRDVSLMSGREDPLEEGTVFLPGESHGQRSLQYMGSQWVRHDWRDLAHMDLRLWEKTAINLECSEEISRKFPEHTQLCIPFLS